MTLFDQIKALDVAIENTNKTLRKIKDEKDNLHELLANQVYEEVKKWNEYKAYAKAVDALNSFNAKSVVKEFDVVFHLERDTDHYSPANGSDFQNTTFMIVIDSLHSNGKALDFANFSNKINYDSFCEDILRLVPHLSEKWKKVNDVSELGYDSIDESIESLKIVKDFDNALATKLNLKIQVTCKSSNDNFDFKILNFSGTKVGKKLILDNLPEDCFVEYFNDDDDTYFKIRNNFDSAWNKLSEKVSLCLKSYECAVSYYEIRNRIQDGLKK